MKQIQIGAHVWPVVGCSDIMIHDRQWGRVAAGAVRDYIRVRRGPNNVHHISLELSFFRI